MKEKDEKRNELEELLEQVKKNPIRNLLCIDPGKVTGFAWWDILSPEFYVPARFGTIVGCIPSYWDLIYLELPKIDSVVIEDQAVWASSQKSKICVARGDLIGLAQLAGGYAALSWELSGRRAIMISPNSWKGQLTKKAVVNRIEDLTGNQYKNHVADAVGMGLALVGKL